MGVLLLSRQELIEQLTCDAWALRILLLGVHIGELLLEADGKARLRGTTRLASCLVASSTLGEARGGSLNTVLPSDTLVVLAGSSCSVGMPLHLLGGLLLLALWLCLPILLLLLSLMWLLL